MPVFVHFADGRSVVRVGRAEYAGHSVRYLVLGHGPPLVVPKPHREPSSYPWAAWLAARYEVIQIEPLGHGRSDRPREHPAGGIHEQIHAVMDQEGVDRCPVWGYSAGGAMALAVAQASSRVTAVVSGGWSPAERQSDAALRRIDRLGRMPVGQRAFIDWCRRFNWLEELAAMSIPRLVYVGTEDGPRMRGPRGIPRTRGALIDAGATLLEFDGLDHITCMNDPAFATQVGPAIVNWLHHANTR